MRPLFSFWFYPKRERAAPGVREKGACARSGAAALRARRGSAYRCPRFFKGRCSDAAGPFRPRGPVPAAGYDDWTGYKTAFDALLFPRVPLRYALPVPSRGNGRMWTSAPTGALSARRPQGPTPQGGFSCPCGAIHLLPASARCRGLQQSPVQRQRNEEQELCVDHPDDRRTRHAG